MGNALIARAERLCGVAVVEGPGTTDAAATAYAGELTASRRAYLVDPPVQLGDGDGGRADAPCSARSDSERGFWWSPSNRPILGILGTSRPIDFALGDENSRANLLNEAKVATIIREDGYRLWGNRTLSSDPKYAFLSIARTADLIQDSLLRAHLWAVDRNITREYLEAVAEGVNAYLRDLRAEGAIAGGNCQPSDTNSAAKIAAGQACWDVEFTPYSPAERVTFRVALVDDYLEEIILMAIVNILRNVNVFVDGRGYAGHAQEVTLPKLTIATEEHRAGGLDAPIEIDMGMEKLEAMWTMDSVDADMLRRWGLAAGGDTAVNFRGALQSEDGSVRGAAATCRGVVREVDFGAWKPGEKSSTKYTMAVRFYELAIDGETVHRIDVPNMVREIDGVDALAEQRAALGI